MKACQDDGLWRQMHLEPSRRAVADLQLALERPVTEPAETERVAPGLEPAEAKLAPPIARGGEGGAEQLDENVLDRLAADGVPDTAYQLAGILGLDGLDRDQRQHSDERRSGEPSGRFRDCGSGRAEPKAGRGRALAARLSRFGEAAARGVCVCGQ